MAQLARFTTICSRRFNGLTGRDEVATDVDEGAMRAGRDEAMAVAAALSATYDVVLPAMGPVAGAHVVTTG